MHVWFGESVTKYHFGESHDVVYKCLTKPSVHFSAANLASARTVPRMALATELNKNRFSNTSVPTWLSKGIVIFEAIFAT